MAARATSPEKRPGFFSQIRSLYSFTRSEFSFLPVLLVGIILVTTALGVLIAFLIQPTQWWNVVLWAITGLMFGVLASMITMTQLSTRVMYRKLDGMPGGAGHVVANMLGRNWAAEDMPVGVNPKTQDAVYRAIGRGGVAIVAEGSRGRLTRLVNDERMKVARVANGVPITVFYVGHGDDDVAIKDLAKAIKRLPKKIDRATMSAVVQRIDSVSRSVTSLPIPKGIDPQRARAQRPR